MSEPSSVKPFPDARPPHLPDTLTRLSPWLLFFVVIVALQLVRLAQSWQSSVTPGDAKSAIDYTLSWIPSLASPLAGAALFYRHPDARRTMRVLVFGLVLLSFGELLSAFQEPIRTFLRSLSPAEDLTSPYETPAEFAFRVFTLLLTIFGLLYVGAGLANARVREATKAERPLAVWMGALAIVGSIVSLAVLTSLPPDATAMLLVQVVVGVVLSAVITFAWAYLTVVTISGWIAREVPRRAWGFGALAASILFGFRLIFPALSLVPFGPESGPFLLLLAYISWVAWLLFILAFVLGLPTPAGSTVESDGSDGSDGSEGRAAADVTGGGADDATGDPPGATSPGS